MDVFAVITCTAAGQIKAGHFYLSVYFIRLCCHDEVVFMQPPNSMRPKLQILVARNHKHLVDHPSINLETATNHKTLLLSLVD